jgi:hypothetical protein
LLGATLGAQRDLSFHLAFLQVVIAALAVVGVIAVCAAIYAPFFFVRLFSVWHGRVHVCKFLQDTSFKVSRLKIQLLDKILKQSTEI